MEKKTPQPSSSPPPSKKRYLTATRNSRKLLIRRLREIDRLSSKELESLMADAEQLKRKLHGE